MTYVRSIAERAGLFVPSAIDPSDFSNQSTPLLDGLEHFNWYTCRIDADVVSAIALCDTVPLALDLTINAVCFPSDLAIAHP
jgi:hypothetical protein